LFFVLGPPLGAMLVVSVIVVLWLARRGGSPKAGGEVAVATPLAIWPALQLAGLMFAVRVLSEFAVLAIGNAGLILMAALSGIVDVDALTVAASQQAAASGVSDGFAAAAICVAVAVNTIAKGSLL